jgi:4-amino-4-deoxy-L-arabinose transferase-like glycosyltransferase
MIKLLLGISAVVILWNIPYEPCYVHGDEANIGMAARGLMVNGCLGLTAIHFYQFPEPFFIVPAITMQMFGDNLFGLRMSGAILGLLTIFFFYRLALRWYTEEIAFCSSLMLLANTFFLYLSKTGIQCIQATFFFVLVFYLLDLINQTKRIHHLIGFAIVLGISQYFYTANVMLPVLFVIAQLINPRLSWRWTATSICVTALVTTILMYPLLQSHMLTGNSDHAMLWNQYNWEHMNAKYDSNENVFKLMWCQVKYSFGGVFFYPDAGCQFGSPNPILNMWTFLLFLASTIYIKDYRVMLPWIVIVLTIFLGSTLSYDPPFYPHYAGIVPFFYLSIAFVLTKIPNKILLSVVLLILITSAIEYREWIESSTRNIHYSRTLLHQYDRVGYPPDVAELKNSETYRFLSGELR